VNSKQGDFTLVKLFTYCLEVAELSQALAEPYAR